jgi:adenylate kinase family enzyme
MNMKITIIGTSGSGKSTLSRKISEKFNIQRLEIDRIWFKYDGHHYLKGCTPEQKEAVNQKILAEVEQFLQANQNWVIDGTYSKIQPIIAERADSVVLIQLPLLFRLYSHIIRVFKGDNRHPEVTPLQDLHFTRTLIKRWRNGEDRKLIEFVKMYKSKLVVLRSFTEIDDFFKALGKN